MGEAILIKADEATITLNGRILTDFVAGDVFTFTAPNPASAQTPTSDGGVTISRRADADVRDLKMRLHRASSDDSWMNKQRFGKDLTVFKGSIKIPYLRNGVAGIDSWLAESGSITDQGEVTVNDTEGAANATMEYTIRFRKATRTV